MTIVEVAMYLYLKRYMKQQLIKSDKCYLCLRRRNGFVVIAMEAMDQLLVACHAQTLNLFVESFLKMVQKLLESTDPQLQILATQSVSNDHWQIQTFFAISFI